MADVKAVTRIEAILNGEDITPVTREEAILSGADVEPLSREEYFVQKRLGEGGGSTEYVIPEQTVTFTSSDALVEIQEEGLDDIPNYGAIIAKFTIMGHDQYNAAYSLNGSIESNQQIYFYKEDNVWKAMLQVEGASYPITSAISAIRGF